MRKGSVGRRSSSNPVRISILDRDEKNAASGGRSEPKRGQQTTKTKGQNQSQENSQIPKPRIRSSSSERSSMRASMLKPQAPSKTPMRQRYGSSIGGGQATGMTPLGGATTPSVGTNYLHPDLPSGSRHRSPSGERASGFSNKGAGAGGVRKDGRALNDKAYQAWMLNKVDGFFREIQQSTLLNTNGSLKPASLKIFVDATACLLHLLNVKFDLTVGNYVEELPRIANKIHYPGAMTKSWLKTANTIHSWPHVLGWLSWLVEFCEARDIAFKTFQLEQLPFIGPNGKDERCKKTFLAMLKFYAAWNAGNLEEEAALMEKYFEDARDMGGNIEEEIARMEKEIESLKSEDRAMNRKSSELEEDVRRLEERLKLDKLEEERELAEIEEKEKYLREREREFEELKGNVAELEDQIQRGEKQNAELKIYIENQPMPVEKRNEIATKCSELQSHINQFESHIEDIEKELYAMDMKFAGINQKVYAAILRYNKDVILKLGNNQDGPDPAQLILPETNMQEPEFLVILREKVSVMNNYKETVSSRIARTESDVEARKNEIETMEKNIESLREEKEEQAAKMREHQASMKEIEERAMEKKAKIRKEIKEIENDIAELQKSMPDLEVAAAELAETKDKLEAVARRKAFLEKQAERFFNKFFQMYDHHKNELRRMVDATAEEFATFSKDEEH